ncbi:MAG TPA: tetratricopeptide repeat protein [Candidatus Binatia bacterium]|jgi:tetratricopeptide (TPR) repeat protein
MRALPIAFALLLAAGAAYGADAGPVAAPPADAPASSKVTAQMRYNEGEAFAREQKWPFAESAFVEATKVKPDFPEAWNGLGHARKMQRKFPDALTAYQEALRLKPEFPQALEYLGETYVEMGKTDEARATLAKLQPLDAALAKQLSQAIDGKKATGTW